IESNWRWKGAEIAPVCQVRWILRATHYDALTGQSRRVNGWSTITMPGNRILHESKIPRLLGKPAVNWSRGHESHTSAAGKKIEYCKRENYYRHGHLCCLVRSITFFYPIEQASQPSSGKKPHCQLHKKAQPRPRAQVVKTWKLPQPSSRS